MAFSSRDGDPAGRIHFEGRSRSPILDIPPGISSWEESRATRVAYGYVDVRRRGRRRTPNRCASSRLVRASRRPTVDRVALGARPTPTSPAAEHGYQPTGTMFSLTW